MTRTAKKAKPPERRAARSALCNSSKQPSAIGGRRAVPPAEPRAVTKRPVARPPRPASEPAAAPKLPILDSLAAKRPQQMPSPPVQPGQHQEATLSPAQQAYLVQQSILPAALATSLPLSEHLVSANGYRCLLNNVRRDAGNPTDPVEIMMLEQLTVCHFRAAVLHGDAQEAKGVELVSMYNAAAARLTAEFRKTALALKQYRSR